MDMRLDQTPNSKAHRKSLQNLQRKGWARGIGELDDKVLSNAPTPVCNVRNKNGKNIVYTVPSVNKPYTSDLASILPRRLNFQSASSGGSAARGVRIVSENVPSPSRVNDNQQNASGAGSGSVDDRLPQNFPRNDLSRLRVLQRPSSGKGQGLRRSADPALQPANSPNMSTRFMVGSTYPIIDGRFYWASVSCEPAAPQSEHWFSTDRTLVYSSFCADFGPMNLSAIVRYVKLMKEKMSSEDLKGKKIVHFTGASVQNRTNCVFLIGCYLLLDRKMSPAEIWNCFSKFEPSPFLHYRDATFVRSTWDLKLEDCWRGLHRGIETGLIDIEGFNPDEYDYYDHPQHGDMHVIVPRRFIAFKGPTGRRYRLAAGLYSHTPKDYIEVFRHHNVSAIVRLNNKEYDRNEFVKNGFNHYDLFFEDCTTPSELIVSKFMDIVERERGVIAVHCLAGLGRTGTLIGLWIMRNYDFTAEEVIAYLRIIRPGSIIGPQQQYLCDCYQKLKNVKEASFSSPGRLDYNSAALAKEVKEGMLRRHIHRIPSNGMQGAGSAGEVGGTR